jgi:DUF4097 and DUF4098 domain-containing protein YvlB
MLTTRTVSLPALLAILGATTAAAQQPAPRLQCEDGWRGGRNRSHVCDIREVTVRASGALTVDAGPNGSIQVIGADRDDVLVRAMVQAWANDEDEAREIAGEVVVHTDDAIRAEGPDRDGRQGWSVSYEIHAPRATDLRLETHNGGIAIANLRGDLNFDATNGGIHLDGVAGNVHGSTTNGGVEVTLTGERWDGETLDVRTTNGGIRLRVPQDYSARLETRTVNGGMNIDFPVTVQGRLGRQLSTTLGDGGPLVRAQTTNGGVRVSRY